ncbi:hypothetical protein DFH06DRAFT_1479690 [Mycena polygramma]|nr:hypothetical protein DFH06DRAFT_1479690 [Mycena polygramma]
MAPRHRVRVCHPPRVSTDSIVLSGPQSFNFVRRRDARAACRDTWETGYLLRCGPYQAVFLHPLTCLAQVVYLLEVGLSMYPLSSSLTCPQMCARVRHAPHSFQSEPSDGTARGFTVQATAHCRHCCIVVYLCN